MKAYVFPGQGAQFTGMGKSLYETSELAKELFEKANEILGFRITDIMFEGSEEQLRQTNVTQPAVFLHSVILAKILGTQFQPNFVAGHSLGELSALTAAKAITFGNGLHLVAARANAMQKACEAEPSAMAAILGLEDQKAIDICAEINEIVVPANFNTIGQLVISGSEKGIEIAMKKMSEAGAKRTIKLSVGGAFHSPLMEPARAELAQAIENTLFIEPICPVFQNVTAEATTNPTEIKKNLIAQLTAPVRWTEIMQNMIAAGITSYTEVGPGKILQGLMKKVNRKFNTSSAENQIL